VHLFLLGLLHEWEVELQHLNPNGVLHIMGYFYARALTVKRDPLPAAVEGFGLQKRPRPVGDYPAYTPADSNWGWHEYWFYIRNLE
jgi:hypothetical protein